MLDEDYKRVCSHCLKNDPVLFRMIVNDPDSYRPCDYCDNEDLTMSMHALGNKTDWLIENYYSPGEVDHEYGVQEGSPLIEILEQEVSSNIDVIKDLSKILLDCWFEWGTEEHKYGEDPLFISAISISSKLSNKWALMEKKLRESNRFFNHDALETFDEVFGYLFDNHPSIRRQLPLPNSLQIRLFIVAGFLSPRMTLSLCCTCQNQGLAPLLPI